LAWILENKNMYKILITTFSGICTFKVDAISMDLAIIKSIIKMKELADLKVISVEISVISNTPISQTGRR